MKKDVQFFNNFIQDPKLPEKSKPKPVSKPTQPESYPPVERAKASVKDRLGFRNIKDLNHRACSDPRIMVDYTALDFNDDLFKKNFIVFDNQFSLFSEPELNSKLITYALKLLTYEKINNL